MRLYRYKPYAFRRKRRDDEQQNDHKARPQADSADHRLLTLQRQVGNQALLSMLQADRSMPASGVSVQRALQYVDTTAGSDPRQWPSVWLRSWRNLVYLFPDLSSQVPLDDRLFQNDINLVKRSHGYTLNILNLGWTYSNISISEAYRFLKRLEAIELHKHTVNLDSGTSLWDSTGIGLSVVHSAMNEDKRTFSGRYKVMEGIHKIEDNSTYQLTVDASDTFTDFHRIPHRKDAVPLGTTTVHQIWFDMDNRSELIPHSGFEIKREIERVGEDEYIVKISKKPKRVAVKGVSAEAGEGSAYTRFRMRWTGKYFDFVK